MYNKKEFSYSPISTSLKVIKKKDSLSKSKFYHQLSLKNYNNKKYKKAIKFSLLELKYLKKKKEKANILYHLGVLYLKIHQYNTSIHFFRKAISLNTNSKEKGKAFCKIGLVFYYLGKYYKSASYYRKGIKNLETLKENRNLLINYINFSYTLSRINTKAANIEQLIVLKKASLLLKTEKSNKFYYAINLSLADLYSSKFNYDFDKSKLYYTKNISKAIVNKNLEILQSNYINLGDLFLKKNIDSSFYYYNKSKLLTSNKDNLAIYYSSISYYYLLKGYYQKSLDNINKSLQIQTKNNITQLIDINIKTINNKYNFLYYIKEKIKILIKIYSRTNKKKYLKTSINYVNLYDRLVKDIRKENVEDKTKLYWQNNNSEAYFLGVKSCYLLKDYKTMFYFIEKNKAVLLSQDISKNTQLNFLPKNIAIKESKFKNKILSLEDKISNKKNKESLQDSLFTVKKNYEKYIDSLKIVYPQFFNSTIENFQVSLTEVQNKIDKNTIIVSYLWGGMSNEEDEDEIYGLIISKKEIYPFKITNIIFLKQLIKKYQQLISKPFETKSEQQEFYQISFQLFQKLFPKKVAKNKKLIIMPDGAIQNIAFDALITKDSTSNYLIQTNPISYTYSMSFLDYNNQLKRITTSNFIGFAPVNFDSLHLNTLLKTKKEVSLIKKILKGKTYINNAAKKSVFLNTSNQTKIIHLATHADATNNPWVAFSDSKLKLHELYTYKNNAELVVLSGCNTSLGEIAAGEGILSLARGFFYSGAKAVISSQWNVNDKATSEIMISFYKNIKIGVRKDIALQKAKLQYLKNHSLSETSPYYWASFTLIGNSNKINLSNSYNFLYFTIILTIFGVLIYKIKK